MSMRIAIAIATALCLSLAAGCAGSPRNSSPASTVSTTDSAPGAHFDASQVTDAIPRVEPRSRYGNMESYVVFGQRYHVLEDAKNFRERGNASWYGTKFHGKHTSSREPYDMYQMTAAHKTLPLPSYVRVTNLRNNRSVVVRVNDRGPFHDGRIIDLSYAAALKLDVVATGTAPVEIVVIDPEALDAPGSRLAAITPSSPGPRPESGHKVELPAGPLFIQLGAFSEAANALALKGQLEVADIRPVRIEEQSANRLFRVRLGPFAEAAAADDIALKLVALGITNFNIVAE